MKFTVQTMFLILSYKSFIIIMSWKTILNQWLCVVKPSNKHYVRNGLQYVDIHDIKVRRTKTIESLIEDKLQPKNLNTESTKYGINNEPVKITATQMSDGVTFASIRKSTSDRTLTLRWQGRMKISVGRHWKKYVRMWNDAVKRRGEFS